MSDYYDRKGNPITVEEWSEIWRKTDRTVAKTTLSNGYRVSTVYLGLDHGWGEGPPLIFETMVFGGEDWSEVDMLRYSTEEQALAGHNATVLLWEKEPKP